MAVKHLKADVPDANLLAATIQQAIAGEAHLSHRTYREVFNHIQREEVYCKLSDDEIASFLFATPLGAGVVELHSFFTFPQFRRRGHFADLLERVTAAEETAYLTVTFQPHVSEFLIKKSFRLASLSELPFKVRLRFLMRRLRWRRIISIAAFMSRSQPIYLIKNDVAV